MAKASSVRLSFFAVPPGRFFHSASPHLSRALQEKSSGDQENSRSSSSGSLSIMDLARALTDAGYHVSVVQERSRDEQRAPARPLIIPFSPFIVVTGYTSSPPTPLTPVRYSLDVGHLSSQYSFLFTLTVDVDPLMLFTFLTLFS